MAIGNMHKNLVKFARVVPEMSSRTDRQTHAQRRTIQYFATAPASEVGLKVVIRLQVVRIAIQNTTWSLCKPSTINKCICSA